jgi:hypothetical protein
MKITKRHLRRIIKEAVETSTDPYDYDPGANYNAKAWEAWIRSEGGDPDDLDEIARIFGAPDRYSLGPVVTGAGEVSLEDALDALFEDSYQDDLDYYERMHLSRDLEAEKDVEKYGA